MVLILAVGEDVSLTSPGIWSETLGSLSRGLLSKGRLERAVPTVEVAA